MKEHAVFLMLLHIVSPWKVSLLQFSAPRMSLTYQKPFLLTDGHCKLSILHDIACAPLYDGVSEIIFQILRRECPNYVHTVPQKKYLYRYAVGLHGATTQCSSTTVSISNGVYSHTFNGMMGYQLNLQVSMAHDLHNCTAPEIHILITLRYLKIGLVPKDTRFGYVYLWQMEKDSFECAIRDYGDSIEGPYGAYYVLSINLYISVKSNDYNNIELNPNISSCYQTMLIETSE